MSQQMRPSADELIFGKIELPKHVRDAVRRSRKRRKEVDAIKSVLAETELKNCGTGAGGFQPGNSCGRGDGSGSGGGGSNTRAGKVMREAPLTSKGAAKWKKEAAQAYAEDEEFRAVADGVALYTQGGYEAIQDTARVMDGNAPRDSAPETIKPDEPISFGTHPMASYKPMVEGQDLMTSKTTMRQAVTAIRTAIRESDPLDVEIFRGITMPHHAGSLAGSLGKWIVGLKPGDEVSFDVPTSFTADAVTAEKFAQRIASGQGTRRDAQPGIVIEIEKGSKGLKVAALSPWKTQQEVLTEGKFEVVKVTGKLPERIMVPGPPRINPDTRLYEYGPEVESYWYGPNARKQGGVQTVITLRPKT